MKLALTSGAVLLIGALGAQAQMANAPAAAVPSLSLSCHLLYRGVPMKEPTTYEVIGKDLYGVSGPLRTRLSEEGTAISLGKAKEADGTVVESFASHRLNGTTLERTVFWKKGNGLMQQAFTETYDFRARTVRSSSDRADFCHADGK
ncbi:hypothetical protein LJ725_25365 [Reyranella aquatilis]|uniref:DUF3108 domain-containing protein n=1 Tax=Reyranella aquatilis TaxID=2035356 RepID=A0ABS8L393_9HYPH|nr:hypothetical protein [Reyranella aquatilis]MCC8432318.1 hypothetical protein [Reyranella aquatilis]